MLSVSALLPLFPCSAVTPPNPHLSCDSPTPTPQVSLAQAAASLCLQEAPGVSVPVALLAPLPSGPPCLHLCRKSQETSPPSPSPARSVAAPHLPVLTRLCRV